MDIRDKVVVITGASAGIGLAAAHRLAAAGAKIALAARSTDLLEKTVQELNQQGHQAISIPTDMRNPQQVQHMIEAAVQHFGCVDVLINNAGQALAGRVADINLADYQQIIELNIFGTLYGIQAVVPTMREHGGGLILNISSMVSKMNIPGLAGYASTKSALNMLSDTARGELAPDNIRVITVYPRLTSTDFGKNALGNREGQQQRQAQAGGGERIVDTAEHVAERILQAIENEPAEQYMD